MYVVLTLPGSITVSTLVALSVGLFDAETVARRQEMALVYVAISAFETSIRQLVTSVMLEGRGAGWWETDVSEN